MVQTFLLFATITTEKTLKFMQRDIITSTITWHHGLVGSNNFGDHTSFSLFTLENTIAVAKVRLKSSNRSRNDCDKFYLLFDNVV